MRDFFYNRNDVIVATVIILVAAFVIYMRIGVIMDYPAIAAGAEEKTFIQSIFWWSKDPDEVIDTISSKLNLDGDDTPAVENPVQSVVETPVANPHPDPVQTETPPAEVTQDPPAEVTQNPPAEQPATPPAEVTPPPQEQPVSPTSEVTITVVAGDVGSTIGDKLVSAGAITDKNAFVNEVLAQGAATKLKQGTFKIPAGSTMAEIVKILVG